MLKDHCIRFDWAIKRLLRQKANFGVLEGFLTVFLNEKVEIVEILESEGNQEAADDKFNRVDIKAKNSKGEIIIVEVLYISILYYYEHLIHGVNKTILERIKTQLAQQEIKNVYSIYLFYLDFGIGTDYLYHGQNQFTGVHTKDQLVVTAREKNVIVPQNPSEIFPEYLLARMKEFNQVAISPLEEWMEYLKNGIIKENTSAPGLREAREKLQYYSMSDAERYAYDEHINAVMIHNDVLGGAREEGFMEGMNKERIKNAIGMKAADIPIGTIASITGLSEEEILKL